jgi:hypothetical protein
MNLILKDKVNESVLKIDGHIYDVVISEKICELIYDMDLVCHMNSIMNLIDKCGNFRISCRHAVFADIIFDYKNRIICVYKSEKFMQYVIFDILWILGRIFGNRLVFVFPDCVKHYFAVNKIILNGFAISDMKFDDSCETYFVLSKLNFKYKTNASNFYDLNLINYNGHFNIEEDLQIVMKSLINSGVFVVPKVRIQFIIMDKIVIIRLLDIFCGELELMRYLIDKYDGNLKIVIILLSNDYRWMYNKNHYWCVKILESNVSIKKIYIDNDKFKLNINKLSNVNLLICDLNWSTKFMREHRDLITDKESVDECRESLNNSTRSVGSFIDGLSFDLPKNDRPFRTEPFGGFYDDF